MLPTTKTNKIKNKSATTDATESQKFMWRWASIGKNLEGYITVKKIFYSRLFKIEMGNIDHLISMIKEI